MIDYRLKENRLEGFLKYYKFILETEDYDPWYYTSNYIFKRYELNIEQQFWLSWLYGFIYNGCSAWVTWNEFPDFENVDINRLIDWENINWKNMDFETDTKYKKGKIHQAFPHYKQAVSKYGSQREFFNRVCSTDDPYENFRRLWKVINGFYLFGRYSSFFYIETLKMCNNLPIECDSLMLEDIGGSKSHRNGLCLVLGKDEWDDHKSNPNFKGYNKEMLRYLNDAGDDLISMMKKENPHLAKNVTYFTLETALCAFKGFFRRRRYPSFYLDRDCHQISSAQEKGWNGIDWQPFWDARSECLDHRYLCEKQGYYKPKKEYQNHFMLTGEMINIDNVEIKHEKEFSLWEL